MVDWPGVCEKYAWDAKALCGPVIMADSRMKNPTHNCVHGHPERCAAHKPPLVGGKPFQLQDHASELTALGLTKVYPELATDHKAGKKPPGVPKKQGNALVYPARHFA